MNNKIFWTIVFFMLITTPLFAGKVADQIEKWGTELKLVVNAAAAVGALWGITDIAWKYYTGDENANKNMAKWVKGLAFVALATLIINFFIPASTTP